MRTWGDGGIYDHVLSYDKRKHVTFVTNSLGQVTQYHMNVVGQVVKVVDPLGGETKMDPADHKRTASNGSMAGSEAYRQRQKDLLDQARAARDAGDMSRARSLVDDAIQMDIDDAKQFTNKYDDAIMEMIDSLDDDFYDRITKDKKPCP